LRAGSGLSLLLVPTLALAQGEAQKLDALRSRIEEMRAKIAESEESRTEVRDQAARLRARDLGGQPGAAHIGGRRAAADEELRSLSRRSQALEAEIASRRETLGRLLTLRYLNGEQSGVKLLLSGEEPSRIARELHYYSYVSRAQNGFIEEPAPVLARLKELEAALADGTPRSAAIESARRAERAALMRQQAEHRKVLTGLEPLAGAAPPGETP